MSINSLLLTSRVPPLCFLRGKNTAQLGLTHPFLFCTWVICTHVLHWARHTYTSFCPSADDINPTVFTGKVLTWLPGHDSLKKRILLSFAFCCFCLWAPLAKCHQVLLEVLKSILLTLGTAEVQSCTDIFEKTPQHP